MRICLMFVFLIICTKSFSQGKQTNYWLALATGKNIALEAQVAIQTKNFGGAVEFNSFADQVAGYSDRLLVINYFRQLTKVEKTVAIYAHAGLNFASKHDEFGENLLSRAGLSTELTLCWKILPAIGLYTKPSYHFNSALANKGRISFGLQFGQLRLVKGKS